MRVALAWLVLVFLTLAGRAPALAHAALLTSDPADSSVLAESPRRFVLTFNEPVSPLVMRLVEADGATADLKQFGAENQSVMVTLPKIGRGTHALSWRVISADGHPVGGVVVFSVGAISASGMTVATATPPALAMLVWASHVVLYLCLFVGIGGTFFSHWVAVRSSPRAAIRIIEGALIAGLLVALGQPGLEGADALATGLAGLSSITTWVAGATTSYGLTLAFEVAAMLLALVAGRLRQLALGREIAALALVALGVALSLSGHASTATPQWLTRPAVFVHGLGLALWLGALVPLAFAMRYRGPFAERALTRFSLLIPLPLLALVGTGVVLAVVQIERVDALWTTTYGEIFLLKVGLVAALLGLAAWNRWFLTARVAAKEGHGRRAMMHSIAAEGMLVLAILAAVAAWRFTPPPRALAAVARANAPAHVHIHTEKAMADVTVTPGTAGPVAMSISILNGEFAALDAQELTITLADPASGIEPIRKTARHIEGAAWRIDDLTIPKGGQWELAVNILVDEFTQITLEDRLTIAAAR